MTMTPVEKDVAAERLRAASFLPDRSDDSKLLALARWLVSMDDPESPDGLEARRSVTLTKIIERARDALGEAKPTIHSFGESMIGADWLLDSALEFVAAGDSVDWVDHPLGHDLRVRVGDRIVYFEVARPEEG